MNDKLLAIKQKAEVEIAKAQTAHDINNLRSHFIGKKSELNDFMKQLGSLSPEERPAFGKQINDIKVAIEQLLAAAEVRIDTMLYQNSIQSSQFDYTMPGRPYKIGSLHPITQVFHKIEDVFISMGYQIAEGYDIEDEFHNFDALNTPKDHPARNLADTFYIENAQQSGDRSDTASNELLLRTHTSTVQIRVMENYAPPIKVVSPGRCYRNDKFDMTHSPVFHQIECLAVDIGLSFADLRDTMNTCVKKMFGSDCKFRFRPHFFPFTEPSAEVDISCFNCAGKGCPTCKNSGWIEIAGAGMVDPNVFKQVGIDSEKYSGFAFAFGIDRMAMLTYHIPDIRLLYENDLRFLRQF